MSTYHESIIELLRSQDKQCSSGHCRTSSAREKEKPEMVRNLIFEYELFCNNKILNPKELYQKIKNTNINEMNIMLKDLLKELFSKTYLYVELHKYIKILINSMKNISPNNHLKLFKKTYEELIYGRSRS